MMSLISKLILLTEKKFTENDFEFFKELEKFINQYDLIELKGKVKEKTKPFPTIGHFKQIVAPINLEATELLTEAQIKDFFDTKNFVGGVSNDIFSWLPKEVKNSPVLEMANYEFTENITEQSIIDDAKAGGVYQEVDLAHIKQVCERHFSGEKILKEDGSANLFWVRHKNGDLCKVSVWLYSDGWYVSVYEFDSDYEWNAGRRSLFNNKVVKN